MSKLLQTSKLSVKYCQSKWQLSCPFQISVQNQPQDLWEWRNGHSSLTWVDIVFCLEPSSNPNPLFAAASFLSYSLSPLPYLWILSLPTLTKFLFLKFHKETKAESVFFKWFSCCQIQNLCLIWSLSNFSLLKFPFWLWWHWLSIVTPLSLFVFSSLLLFHTLTGPKWSCSQHWVLRPLPF